MYIDGNLANDKSKASVVITFRLLRLNEKELKRSLTLCFMITTKGCTVGNIIKLVVYINFKCNTAMFNEIHVKISSSVPLKKDQATNARDALAKALYMKIFHYIVNGVNQCFPFTSSHTYFGVLDIAGFGRRLPVCK